MSETEWTLVIGGMVAAFWLANGYFERDMKQAFKEGVLVAAPLTMWAVYLGDVRLTMLNIAIGALLPRYWNAIKG